MSQDTNSLGSIGNSRTDDQRQHMQSTVGQGKCPFCPKGFDPKRNVVTKKGLYWQAWNNPFPYPGQQTHIILATLEHITNIRELSPQAWAELGVFIQDFINEQGLPGGGIVMRFGDNSYNGGTLTHLHVHIQVPNKQGPSIAVFYKDDTLTKFLSEVNQKK